MNAKEELLKLTPKISNMTYMSAKTQIEFFENEKDCDIKVSLNDRNVVLAIDLGVCTADGRSEITIDMELQDEHVVFFAFSSRSPKVSSDALIRLFKLSSFFQQKDGEVHYH